MNGNSYQFAFKLLSFMKDLLHKNDPLSDRMRYINVLPSLPTFNISLALKKTKNINLWITNSSMFLFLGILFPKKSYIFIKVCVRTICKRNLLKMRAIRS